MTPEELLRLLEDGRPVPLSSQEWEVISHHFPVEERHQTQLAGELLIVRTSEGLVAIEAPSREARVARLLGGVEEVREFVAKRLEEYERMWDGCGVKVDYFG